MTTATVCPVCEMSGQGCRTGGNGQAVCYVCQADIINGHRLIRQGLDGGYVYEPIAGPSAEDRPPPEREVQTMALEPVPASELAEGPAITWLWDGYLSPGHTTMLAGLWKCGKSTLLGHYLKRGAEGGYLATRIAPASVLVVTEESSGIWRRRYDDLDIGDHAHFLCQPIPRMPEYPAWLQFVGGLADLTFREGYKVVVLDSLAAFWSVKNENDAADVMRALTPLKQITEAGAGLLLTHHPRKSGGDEGVSARGSGAISAFVDVLVEFRRYNPAHREDTRRVLTSYSRFDETPPEIVLELRDVGYVTIGTKADAGKSERAEALRQLLPTEAPGMTAKEIIASWPGDGIPRPSVKTLRRDLAAMENVRGAGRGTRADPCRFWRDAEDNRKGSDPFGTDTPLRRGGGVRHRIMGDS